MCDTFTCDSCHENFANRCKNAAFESESLCDNIIVLEEATNCETCTTVNGVIDKLHTLVFQAPFLKTAGMSGLEYVSSWERKEIEDALKSKVAWDYNAESREERLVNARRVKAMGLGCIMDERDDHQGFTMALTPDNTTGYTTMEGTGLRNKAPDRIQRSDSPRYDQETSSVEIARCTQVVGS